LNEKNNNFEHYESIGLVSAGRNNFSATEHTGEFGAVLMTEKIQHITDIPSDTRFNYTTVSGDFIPKEIITIPILAGKNEVVAVVSLASLHKYSAQHIRLVKDVWRILTARLNGVLAFNKIRAFSDLLEQQNSELEAQKKEMQVQRDELSEQNIELELQKNQLDEASRLKSAFLSNMSHELRTPLNSVIALSSVLNRRLKDTIPDEEYSYLDVIERNGKMLLSLINDILDLSRIEAGKEEVVLSRFSVREIVADVVIMIEPQAREKGIELITYIGEDLPPLRSDYLKCRHILQNLISNAVKFTGDGSVTVSAEQIKETMKISIKDTGIGIADDKLKYIFDEFRQADETMTRMYGGSGLGLTIANKYAVLLHGDIHVESESGVGSTFTVTLPLSIDIYNNAEQSFTDMIKYNSSANKTAISNGHGKTILLVEDSEPAIIQLTDILVTQGYNVRVAHNGKEAIEQIEMVIPDAMILDLMMPEVDGFEVLKSIRSAEKTSQLPVIILTAKHVTREELSFLTGNHIHQLIQKGDINKNDLLMAIGKMVTPPSPVVVKSEIKPVIVAPINGKPVILVVEDNPDNMMTVKALLKDHFVIIEAEDGQIGVNQAITHIPHLILMDISLPVMDGIKALQAIRNIDNLRHIPIVALTASAMKGNREEILSYGFDGYIPKPVEEELLIKTISEQINGNR
jgi:signal transduction histidine kinase/CheY-like chemotaxis protein